MYFMRTSFCMLLLVIMSQAYSMQDAFICQVVENYKNMSQDERDQLVNKDKSLKSYTANLDCLIELAAPLLEKYPAHYHIVALGQSGAYPVLMAKMLSLFNNEKRNFCFAPFSGMDERGCSVGGSGWSYTPPSTLPHTDFYDLLKFPKEFYDSKEYRAYYEQILEPLGLAPDKIMERYKKNKSKTIIVDLVESGRSVGSFVSLLIGPLLQSKYSMEEALAAIGVHGLLWNNSKSKRLKMDLTLLPYTHTMEIELHSKQEAFIYMLASGATFGKETHRLVPEFRLQCWATTQVKDFKIDEKIYPQLLYSLHYAVNQLKLKFNKSK